MGTEPHPNEPIAEEDVPPVVVEVPEKIGQKERTYFTPSCLSGVLLGWVTPLLWRGLWGQPIAPSDVPPAVEQFKAEPVVEEAEARWAKQAKSGKKRSLLRLLAGQWAGLLCQWVVFSFIQGIVNTGLRPVLLKFLIEAATDDRSAEAGYLLIALGATLILEGFSATRVRYIFSGPIATGYVTTISGMLQSKAFRLGPGALSNERSLIGNDLMRNYENFKLLSQVVGTMVSLVVGMAVLVYTLGVLSLPGIGILAVVIILNHVFARVAEREESAMLKHTDQRLSIVTRVIEGIKAIKLSAWEEPFLSEMVKARQGEVRHIKSYRVWHMASIQLGRASPVIASCGSFVAVALSGDDLNPADIFAAFTIFQAMRLALIVLPLSISLILGVLLSLRRFEAFLEQPEFQERGSCEGIEAKDAVFSWPAEKDPKAGGNSNGKDEEKTSEGFTLGPISLSVPPGSLVAVVGAVGSGKTSLLSALLGDLELKQGTSLCAQSIGYVPQKAYVVCGSLLHNVVMGRPYDHNRFLAAVAKSALDADIQRLPDGIDTEIGERGVTLSGGQQQRVSIARALYADPDLVVMDDPLAAVDGIVAETIFERCLVKRREEQAVLMALNQLHLLPRFDYIVHLKEGKVIEQGSYADLMAAKGEFAAMMHEVVGSCESGSTSPRGNGNGVVETNVPLADRRGEAASLVKEEGRASGQVDSTVFGEYRRGMGVGYQVLCCVILFLTYGTMGFADRWLAIWTEQYDNDGSGSGQGTPTLPAPSDDDVSDMYMYVYIGLTVAFTALLMATSTVFAKAAAKASESLHNECITRVLHAPVQWFDETPSGRILSRFSSDLSNVDIQLANLTDNVSQIVASIAVLLIVICIIAPLVIPVAVVSAVVYYVQVISIDKANREVKRMANNAMSPVLSTLGETSSLQGRLLLRAMHLGGPIRRKFYHEVEELNRYNLVSCTMIHWGMLTSYSISFVISVSTGVFMLYGPGSDSFSPSMLGLALTYSFLLPYFFLYFSMLFSMFKTIMTALERLLQCRSDGVPQEPAWYTDADKGIETSWPRAGSVSFKQASLVYRPNLPPALREVDLDIQGGWKVGVVGRTGAGKSSLVVLLFRLWELAGGKLTIDGEDISAIGLQTLRKAMAVIPQEPLLLDDTVAKNLDPFSHRPEGDLRAVLSKVGLGSVDLDDDVRSLSAGQRQLISLARALILPAKLVIMDEPTSNIDSVTDEVVQRVVREEWKDRTVVVIAHRLNTIIDSDRVVVMEGGKVAEFDEPYKLLSDPTSRLHGLVSSLGGEALAKLKEKAAAAHRARCGQ